MLKFAGAVTDAVPGAVVSLVTVVVVVPTFATASVTHTRMVLAPSTRKPAAITVACVAGWLLYVPESTTVPAAQVVTVAPTRTSKVPFSLACHVTVVPAPVGLGIAESMVTVGVTLSNVKVTAAPVKVFPALSVALACTVYVPGVCADQVGRAVLLVHAAAVSLLVAEWVLARLTTATCQVVPFQYWPSGRWRVKVVLLALRPTPPVLSATLPLKGAGTVPAE